MSIEIKVEDVLLSMFGSTDSEFIKRFPANAVYYARGDSFDIRGFFKKGNKSSRSYLNERIKKLEDYTNNKTNWNLVSGYVDTPNTVVKHYKDDMNSFEFLSGRIALDKLLQDSRNNSNFSIIVIDEVSQLTRLVSYLHDLVKELARNNVFIFSLDMESIVFVDSYREEF